MNFLRRLRAAHVAFSATVPDDDPEGLPVEPPPLFEESDLAAQTLARWRQYVIDNNLGTPEEMGFDTPTERL